MSKENIEELYQNSEQDTLQGETRSIKDDVVSGIEAYETQKQEKQEKEELDKTNQKLAVQQELENRDLKEAETQVTSSIQTEMKKDPEFEKLVQKGDLPGVLVSYLAKIHDPNLAPAMVRAISQNPENMEKLKKIRTDTGMSKFINQIYTNVIQGKSIEITGRVEGALTQTTYNYDTNQTLQENGEDFAQMAEDSGLS